MGLFSRIAKKLRRRKRKDKPQKQRSISAKMTAAEKLIANNWNIRFTFHEPERKGEKLARKRLEAKRKANEAIPSLPGMSRQVARHQLRRMAKMARQEETVKFTKKRGAYA